MISRRKKTHFLQGPRHYLAGLTVVLYMVLLWNTYGVMGTNAALFTLLPILILPYIYGLRWGVISYFVLAYLITPLLLSLLSSQLMLQGYFKEAGIGLILAFLTTLLIGYIHTLQDRVHRLNSDIKMLSRIDPLTKIYNRRAFYEYLESEFVRTGRKLWHLKQNGVNTIPESFSGIFTVVLLDIDHFKSINDAFGHLVGDFVLKELASLLQTKGIGFRDSDFVGRYGGEEFIILLPDTTGREALIPLERVKQKLKASVFTAEKGEKFSVGFCGGVAQVKSTDVSSIDVVSRADKALHFAKSNGRDQSHFYDDLVRSGISLFEGSGKF